MSDTGNKPYLRAILGKRSSNAAGKHQDRRRRRARTRSAAKSKAIKEAS